MADREPFDDAETAGTILAALAVVCCLAGAVILARDQCWIQLPSVPQFQTGGSPTLIEDDHPTIGEEIDAGLASQQIPGVVGSPVQDLRQMLATEFEATKRTIKRDRLANGTWRCDGCGRDDCQLDEHHVISVSRIFAENWPHRMIYDPDNLVLACRRSDKDGHECGCHFRICHTVNGRSSWSESNPNARRDLATMRKKLNPHSGGREK